MPGDYEPTEKWNMAEAFLKRVDVLLWECKTYRSMGLLDEWYRALDSLYVEVCAKLRTKDEEKISKMLKEIAPSVAKYSTNRRATPDKEIGKLIVNLRKIDMLLHKGLDAKGLLTPKPADARTAIVGQ